MQKDTDAAGQAKCIQTIAHRDTSRQTDIFLSADLVNTVNTANTGQYCIPWYCVGRLRSCTVNEHSHETSAK